MTLSYLSGSEVLPSRSERLRMPPKFFGMPPTPAAGRAERVPLAAILIATTPTALGALPKGFGAVAHRQKVSS
jgi:hypothetical protein